MEFNTFENKSLQPNWNNHNLFPSKYKYFRTIIRNTMKIFEKMEYDDKEKYHII